MQGKGSFSATSVTRSSRTGQTNAFVDESYYVNECGKILYLQNTYMEESIYNASTVETKRTSYLPVSRSEGTVRTET